MRTRLLDIEAKHEHDFKRTILIVDDEVVNLRIIGKILGDEYDLLYAESGEQALDIIRDKRDFLSLILLDLYMGGMHGFEVLDILQADEDLKKIPVIVLTADKEAEVESLHRGAVDFLSKPFDHPEVIKARIKKSIDLFVDMNIIDNTGTDPLTGLLTKQFFFQYANEYDKFHPEAEVDCIVVNFSKFHLINDLYGRAFGDKVLQRIADGLRVVARAGGGVASRVDADIFYLYIRHQEEYEELIEEIKKPLENIMKASDIRIRVGIYQSIGKSATIYQRFDRALMACNSHSKLMQNVPYTLYDTTMHDQELYEAKLLGGIDQAFRDKQFSIVLQPKYDIRDDEPRLCSAEVLVRWNHPEHGRIRPDFFIPLFEDNGLIKELDRYVWAEAADKLGKWKKKYGKVPPVSVNVSRVDIFDPDLVGFLLSLLEKNGLEPQDMHLEITETAYTDSNSQVLSVVKDLQEKGFKIEMDDFGKGYSSLNMLTSLPIDVLKLDMAFIKDIAENNKEMKMVELIIEVGKFLEVPVVAEGVESKEQYLLLKKAGCDVIQGYYFSKPLKAEEYEELLA